MVVNHVRTFKFKVYEEYELNDAPKDLPDRLLTILQQMPILSSLHLSIPEYQTDIFATLFSDRNFTLPTIKTLVLASFNDFMIKHSPNVETISTDGYQFLHSRRGRHNEKGENSRYREHAKRLIENASKARNLTYFEMMQFWSENELTGLSSLLFQNSASELDARTETDNL